MCVFVILLECDARLRRVNFCALAGPLLIISNASGCARARVILGSGTGEYETPTMICVMIGIGLLLLVILVIQAARRVLSSKPVQESSNGTLSLMVNEQIYADNFSECFNQVAGMWNRPAPGTINHLCSINAEVEPPDPVRLTF